MQRRQLLRSTAGVGAVAARTAAGRPGRPGRTCVRRACGRPGPDGGVFRGRRGRSSALRRASPARPRARRRPTASSTSPSARGRSARRARASRPSALAARRWSTTTATAAAAGRCPGARPSARCAADPGGAAERQHRRHRLRRHRPDDGARRAARRPARHASTAKERPPRRALSVATGAVVARFAHLHRGARHAGLRGRLGAHGARLLPNVTRHAGPARRPGRMARWLCAVATSRFDQPLPRTPTGSEPDYPELHAHAARPAPTRAADGR